MQICRPETALLGHLHWADLNVTQSSDCRQDFSPSVENHFNISKMDFKSYKKQFLNSVCILLNSLPSIKTCSLSKMSILNPTEIRAGNSFTGWMPLGEKHIK